MKYKGMDYAKAFATMKSRKEEAIANLRKSESAIGSVADGWDDIELLDIAMSALRKRLPAKPIKAEGFLGKCQQCKMVFEKFYKHCPGCGQKIEWGDKRG